MVKVQLKKYIMDFCEKAQLHIDVSDEVDPRFWVNSLAILKGNKLEKRVRYSIFLLNKDYSEKMAILFDNLKNKSTFNDMIMSMVLIVPDLQYVSQLLKVHAIRRFLKLITSVEYTDCMDTIINDEKILPNMLYSTFSSCKDEFILALYDIMLPALNGSAYDSLKHKVLNLYHENLDTFNDNTHIHLTPITDNTGTFNICGAEYNIKDNKDFLNSHEIIRGK